MKLIVGLGNPGKDYEDTRHNIGFMVVDKLAREIGRDTLVWNQDDKRSAFVAKVGELVIAKPVTFMNNSGVAVKKLADFYKIDPVDVWVIHDDLDLPIGKIRIRNQGGTAGHNGVESIITHLGTDKFLRFRFLCLCGRCTFFHFYVVCYIVFDYFTHDTILRFFIKFKDIQIIPYALWF